MTGKKRSAASVKNAVDNHGTGLEPGDWKVDGGMKWNGIDVNPSFTLLFKVNSINNNEMNIDAHAHSYVDGDNLPDGGYTGLILKQKKVKIGLFTKRTGYYYKGQLCTKTKGTCLTEIFVENNQRKLRMYGRLNGISAWVISGNDASQVGASFLKLEEDIQYAIDNRGTGLEPGEWKVDGGMKWNGIDINPSFTLLFKVNSINNDEMNIDAHAHSYVDGDNLPDGGYKGLILKQTKVKIGLFTKKTGYYYKGQLCTKIKGTCLAEIFIENNQRKLRMYGKVNGISAWVSSGNDAKRN